MPEVVLFLKSVTDDISDENIEKMEKIFLCLDDSGDKRVDFQEFKGKSISVETFENISISNFKLHFIYQTFPETHF